MSKGGALAAIVGQDYGYVVLAAGIMGLQIMYHGMRFAGMGRRSAFTAEYYKQPAVKQLAEEHKKATGEDKLPSGGYPDMGNGRFSEHLSYDAWFKFNSAQRAHYNGLENITTTITCLLLGGLFFPRAAAYAGAAYIVGREIYATGYASKGPAGRNIGAGIVDLAIVVLFGLTMAGGADLAGLIKL